jgi:mono/diheme cytochrome c family protein
MRKVSAIAMIVTAFSISGLGTTSVYAAASSGAAVYAEHCSICHGENKEGILPGFPPLIGVVRRLNNDQEEDVIHRGRGRMPAFPKLQNDELSSLLHFLNSDDMLAATQTSGSSSPSLLVASNSLQPGGPLFQQNCAFCHGRDAAGGESGPDLTRSKLVVQDVAGNKIAEVVRNGRLEKKMPAFKFSDSEMTDLVAFIHYETKKAMTSPGGRRGVDVSDLQTGNVAAGLQYFRGPGGCSSCHSPTGDLAGIAGRYEGLQLEERMLYPRDVKSRVTVILHSGEVVHGTVAYHDEFTIGLVDDNKRYRSWPVSAVKYSIDSPVDAHIALFEKYTDDDIHNLMAYLQTLR